RDASASALKTSSMAAIIGNQKVACQERVFGAGHEPCYRAVSQRRLALNIRVESMSGRVKLAACFSVYFLAGANLACAQQQVIGAPPEASNMKLVGTSDLQARSAYQPTIHHQGDRWIAYIGHHGGTDDIPAPLNPLTGKAEPNGPAIVDVPDPAQPKYLRPRARKENMRQAARRWCASATARRCPRAIATRS